LVTKENSVDSSSTRRTPQIVASAPKVAVDLEDGVSYEPQPPRVIQAPSRARNIENVQNGATSTASTVLASPNDEQKLTITPDERNNTLMVYSDFITYRKIQRILEQIDVQQSQVVIEATVLEVELNDNLSYGVNWYLQNSVSGTSSNLFGGVANAKFSPSDAATTSLPSGGGPGGALTFSNVWGANAVKAVVTALQGVTKVRVISSPYLTVVDGKEASLQIGQEVPFATANLTAQNGAISQTVTTKKTGIILKVTPKINGDDSVMLNVEQEVSSPDLSANGGTLTPVIATRNIKSDVLTQSGSTVALGGLIQNKLNRTTTGLPVASRLPLVGEVFKQTTDNMTKTELLVLITTRVSRSNTEIAQITNALRRHSQIR
jgi:general secretion pathway protein D